jgi:hypothetical protein
MKTKHMILIAVTIVVVLGIIFGVSMRGQAFGGNVGVVEINNIIFFQRVSSRILNSLAMILQSRR